MTSAVAGGHIGAVDQDESAANGLLKIRDMQAQCLSDQRKYASKYPRHCRLTDSEKITHCGLIEILSDIHQRDQNRAMQSHNRRPQLFRTALGNLPDPDNKLVDLVGSKPCSRLVSQRPHL